MCSEILLNCFSFVEKKSNFFLTRKTEVDFRVCSNGKLRENSLFFKISVYMGSNFYKSITNKVYRALCTLITQKTGFGLHWMGLLVLFRIVLDWNPEMHLIVLIFHSFFNCLLGKVDGKIIIKAGKHFRKGL